MNNFDYYKKGNFLYHSYMMEENSHKKRNDLLEIVDINLEYLSDISYNEIKKLDEKDLKCYYISLSVKIKRTVISREKSYGYCE